MIGHKILWDAALKPSLDANSRADYGRATKNSRFEPIELPLDRSRTGRKGTQGSAFLKLN